MAYLRAAPASSQLPCRSTPDPPPPPPPTLPCPQNSWKTCGFDSILLPTTQKHSIVRMSNQVYMTPDVFYLQSKPRCFMQP